MGLNVKELLARSVLEVAISDIHINNDAACFLQGEVFRGTVSGYQHAVKRYIGHRTGDSSL